MGRFINPFTDVGFKRIFGQEISKPVLIAFLNSLLIDERRIVDVTFLDKEKLGLYEGDRSLIYDIYCKTDTDESIIVEMQNTYQPFFKKRSIYYLSRSVVEQGERGAEWKYNIKSVYLVSFLNFKLNDISNELRTDIALMDMKRKTVFSDDIRLIYLQLPYFTKEAEECVNDFERFIFILKHMDILQRMPWAAQDSVFMKLAEIAEVSALSKEERVKYDDSLRKFRDTLVAMEGQFMEGEAKGLAKGREEGLAEGRKEGLAKGREEGREEGSLDIARKMKAKGFSVEEIAELTGCPVTEIEKL